MRYFETEIAVSYQYKGERKESRTILSDYLIDTTEDISTIKKRPAIIICPGGGYAFRSRREAEPVALKYLAAGFHAFILEYSVAPAKWPCAMLELAKAVQTVREHAQEWNIDENKIIVSGFSAGGHLAASLGTLWNESIVEESLGTNTVNGKKLWKPDGMILCYPVITMGKYTHEGSKKNLLGEGLTQEEYDALSLELRVSKDTVPAFFWHTQEDGSVPVENTLQYAMAMRSFSIPFEIHIYEKGGHGLSLCDELTSHGPEQLVPDNTGWLDLAVKWMKRL